MKQEVASAVQELKSHFPQSNVVATEDGSGGAYVIIEPVDLGPRFRPQFSWLGAQIPALYPYADIYPIFIGHDVSRVDGVPFIAPVTTGHSFAGRAAIQISRKNNLAQQYPQPAFAKFVKVLNFLETLP